MSERVDDLRRVGRAGRRYAADLLKLASLRLRRTADDDTKVLLIFGCQRSGTTALQRVFAADRDVVSFGELGLAFERWPYNHRLRPVATVNRMVGLTRASMVVIKPLVESHRVVEILDEIPDSKAVWMYRHYADVASSNLKRFGTGNGRFNMARARSGDRRDWRAQGFGPAETEILDRFAHETLGDHDFAALFWWLRNRLFVDQQLAEESRLRICSYRDLVTEPQATIDAMYGFAGVTPRSPTAADRIHQASVDKGQGIPLDPAVRELCEEMWQLLEKLNGEFGLLHG